MTAEPVARRTIDLNADVGEDPLGASAGPEAPLFALVTSVNVACGGHAGDSATMEQAVALAAARGVAVGAHPGYPDRARFGRVALPLAADEIERLVFEQTAALGKIARRQGVELVHVKPHGALYHAAHDDPQVAAAIARGVLRFSAGLVMVGQSGGRALACWADAGFRTAAEAFADRAYEPDGRLRSRALPGAVLRDPAAAAVQALRIARDGLVRTSDGSDIAIQADTLCIHGDTPGAANVAAACRGALAACGIGVAPLTRG